MVGQNTSCTRHTVKQVSERRDGHTNWRMSNKVRITRCVVGLYEPVCPSPHSMERWVWSGVSG